ncbi:MAG: hypothetical protein IT427_09745 [Pirellulales bacterium]|nr:hypothetical protein [Pirellulales bacterium]
MVKIAIGLQVLPIVGDDSRQGLVTPPRSAESVAWQLFWQKTVRSSRRLALYTVAVDTRIIRIDAVPTMMDAVSLTIALAPLALYLLLLGALNLGRRPRVVSGGVDATWLAAGLAGLLIVGPMNLFLPADAADRFGPFVWLLAVAFYALCTVFYVLVARPRLVVFNMPLESLRVALAEVSMKLDEGAKIVGDAVQLPSLEVQLHLDGVTAMRSATLMATGERQSHAGWRRLHHALKTALRNFEVTPNPRGFSFVAVGLALLGWPLLQLARLPTDTIAQRLSDLLRL